MTHDIILMYIHSVHYTCTFAPTGIRAVVGRHAMHIHLRVVCQSVESVFTLYYIYICIGMYTYNTCAHVILTNDASCAELS